MGKLTILLGLEICTWMSEARKTTEQPFFAKIRIFFVAIRINSYIVTVTINGF